MMTRHPSTSADSRALSVCVVGAGTIGRAVADALRSGEVMGAELTSVLRSDSTAEEVTAALGACDVVIEASTVDAAEEFVPQALQAGKDVVLCSCGALAKHETVEGFIGDAPGRVLLPAGALGGFDVLAAAARVGTDEASVRHTTVKKPAALGVEEELDTAREVFRGSARDAALQYPKTSNSSIALALATLGLDRVEVVVMADPSVERTRHVVEWDSPVGHYEMTFTNAVDPASGGRTSMITAWSVIEVIAGLAAGAGPGVVVLDPVRGAAASS